MASADIKAMILKKQNHKDGKKTVLKDIHRDLIVALTALPIYGKEVRDEEILSIIINGGVRNSVYDRIVERFNTRLKNKEIKKVKGEYRDQNGFIVLVPHS